MENLLYWRDPSGIFLRCLDKEQSKEAMQQFHNSMCGGHHYWKTTAHKISELGTIGPLYFLMYLFSLNLVTCAKDLKENSS